MSKTVLEPITPWVECLPDEMRCCGTVGKIDRSEDESGHLRIKLPFDWYNAHRVKGHEVDK